MIKKAIKKAEKRIKEIKEGLIVAVSSLIVTYVTLPMPVMASTGGASYIQPLVNLKVIMVTICGAAGVIVLIWGAIAFALAYNKQDQNGEHAAINKFITAGILIGITAILTALGA